MKKISYNFGAIRDSVAKLSSMELMKEEKSKTLNAFIEKTNLSSNLKKQQLIYKNIQECKPFQKERLAERFLNQNLNMFKNSNWNEILRENMDIRKELLGTPDVSHVEAMENGELFESINVLIESVSNPAFSSFEEEGVAYNSIIEYLTRKVDESEKSEEKDDAPELSESWKFLTKFAINNFNKRYSHLNESEKEVLGVLISGYVEKEEYLEDIKKENLKIIDSLLEMDNVDKSNQDLLKEFRGKIEKITKVSPKEIDDYILECIELKETLKEI